LSGEQEQNMSNGLATALDRAADTADESADEQREIAAAARRLAHERRSSASASGQETVRVVRYILESFGRNAEHLVSAAGEIRRAWAQTMAEEGLSIRQVGERLGVSHQRVSALLNHRKHRDATGAV
jgi:transposase-like protein